MFRRLECLLLVTSASRRNELFAEPRQNIGIVHIVLMLVQEEDEELQSTINVAQLRAQ